MSESHRFWPHPLTPSPAKLERGDHKEIDLNTSEQILDDLDDHVPVEQMAQGLSARGRMILRALTLCAFLLGVGAASPWWLPVALHTVNALFPPPPYSGSLLYAEYGGMVSALRASDGGVQWTQHDFFVSSQYIQTPDALIFAGLYHGNGAVAAIQPRSGRLMWHTSYPSQYGSPYFDSSSGGRLYVWFPSPDGVRLPLFEALDIHTGALLWSLHEDGYIAGTQSSDASLLDFCSSPQPGAAVGVVVRDAATGAMRRTIAGPVLESNNIGVNCYQSGSVMIFAEMNKSFSTFVAYSLVDGQHLWQATVAGAVSGWDAATLYVSSSPTATSFPVGDSPSLVALATATGHMLWQAQGDYSDLYANDTTNGEGTQSYYFAKSYDGIATFSPSTGKLLWQFNPLDNLNQGWYALFDGNQTLYFVGNTTLYALNAQNGQQRWNTTLPVAERGQGLFSIQTDSRHVYLLGGDGITVRDSASGHVVWRDAGPYNLMFVG